MPEYYIMTYPNYNERQSDEKARNPIPNWYCRFLSLVVGYNITYTPALSNDARIAHKSRVDISN